MSIEKKISNFNLYLKKSFIKSKIILSNNRVNFIKLDKIKDQGYLYIAFNVGYLNEAIFSALSLKKHTEKKIAIFTNINDPRLKNIFDFVGIIKPTHLRSKVNFMSKSPFKKTIFLDSDTYIKNNIDDIFEILDNFDVVGCIDSARKRKYISDKILEYAKIPYGFSEINTGVLGLKFNKKVKSFLEMWQNKFIKYFQETSGWDQPSFRIALWNSKVNLHVLPPEYNIRSKENMIKTKKIKKTLGKEHMRDRILHMHYSGEVHKGKFKLKKITDLEKILERKKIKINY